MNTSSRLNRKALLGIAFLVLLAGPAPAEENTGPAEETASAAPAEQNPAPAEDNATTAQAERDPVPAGTWLFVREGSDEIGPKIEHAVSHMNILVRRIARSRILGANQPIAQLMIGYQGPSVHISFAPTEPTVITPRDGSFAPYTRSDGEVVRANTKLSPGVIRQFFDSNDGKKEMLYRMRQDGTLALEVTVFSERLREPFKYTWLFRKQD